MKLSDLKLNPKNPQKYKDLSKLEKSIKEFPKMMELRPMVYEPETMFVLGGNKRLICLQKLGFKEIPDSWVRSAAELTEAEKQRFIIADNVGFGEWDWEMLKEDYEIQELEEWGVDIPAKEKAGEAEEDNFAVPEGGSETDIVLGDLITIGNHRLLCGDSTNADQVAKLMNSEKADMVFTDPPYNVKISGLGSQNSKNSIGKIHGEFLMAGGEMSREEFISFLSSVFIQLIKNSKDGSIHYVCMDWKHIFEIITAGQLYTEMKNLCIWNKDNGGMGTFYRNKHEMIYVFKNGTAKHINTFELGQFGRYRTNVWDYPMVSSFGNESAIIVNNINKGSEEQKMHPTVKPIKLVADTIEDCSLINMIILDLFLGSGTTMVASHQLKRRCFGMELDPKYCQVIIDRMHKLDDSLEIKINGKPYQP